MSAASAQKVIELSARIAERRSPAPPNLTRRTRARHIIAVGGGKGGIGKSLVSANLGVALAQRGFRVLLVDADLGGANLHTCLGLPQPTLSLSDFVSRRVSRLEELVVPGGVPNLSLIGGALDALDAANPKHQQKVKLLRNLVGLDADYLILDLGAGTSFNVLDFFLVADHGLLVLTPEPTSVENAYRFVKAALYRKLHAAGDELGLGPWVSEALTLRPGGTWSPAEFLQQAAERDLAGAKSLAEAIDAFQIQLVVNQVRGASDEQVGPAVANAWKKFFGLRLDYLGAVRYDDEAWRAVRKRRPLLLEQPECEASRGLRSVAARLIPSQAAVIGVKP